MSKGDSERGVESETDVRQIVREELRAVMENPTTRRKFLGALGLAGMSGAVGFTVGSDRRQESAVDSEAAALRIANDGTEIERGVETLNFGRNLTAGTDGNKVSVNADRGVDVAGTGDGQSRVSRIEVGSGLDAVVEDDTLRITRAETQLDSGAYLARPRDVQSALDDAASDGVARVDLVGGATYNLSEPVEVPPGIALNCSGARIAPKADVNVFELHTQSQIWNPVVRTADVSGYSSSVFHVSPSQFDESFGTNRPVPVWTVSGGWSEMTPGEGTCIELHGVRENPSEDYDVSQHNRNVYFCFVSHNCVGGRRFAYLHREGGDTTRGGHVNSNVIRGYARNATRFVETDDSAGPETNMVNGNKFYLVTQPGSESEWLWYANKGALNELCEWGTNWDYGEYSDDDGDGHAESWYIGANAGMNFVWRKVDDASGGLGSTVVDESEGASGSRYLLLERLGVPVEELGVWEGSE